MNHLQKLFSELTDEELKTLVKELKQLDDEGVLPDGAVRALAHRIAAETGVPPNDARHLAMHEPYRIAACRWAGV